MAQLRVLVMVQLQFLSKHLMAHAKVTLSYLMQICCENLLKREVSLEGGDSKGVEIADYSDLDISDFSQVKFNFDSDDKEVIGDTYIHCDSKDMHILDLQDIRLELLQ